MPENKGFALKELNQNEKESRNGFKPSTNQRSEKKYSVKLQQNTVEGIRLPKPSPLAYIDDNDDADSQIDVAVRHGRSSVITKEIEKAQKNNNLDSLDSGGLAAIHHTTRYNRLEAIEKLLKCGANVNVQSQKNGLTALHIAARFGWLEATEILLKNGADTNLASENGSTSLHFACRRGNLKIIELLLDQKNVDVNAKDKMLRTPLHLACSQGKEAVIMLLVEHGADVFAESEDKKIALHFCMLNERNHRGTDQTSAKMLNKVLEKTSADSIVRKSQDLNGYSILHVAAVANAIDLMKMVLARGMDVNVAHVKTGITPIHIGCKKGYMEMVEILIDGGANLHNMDNKGQTPLHYAAELGQNEVMKFILSKGAHVDARDGNHMTPLLLAASKRNCDPSTVKLLIEGGADVNANEASMKNCLHLAVESENCNMIEYLLEVEACLDNLYSPDVNERVPLHYAAKSENPKILKILLTKQQTLNFQDEDQKTAIYLAAKANKVDNVIALGRAGAAVSERDDDGMTPLHAASFKSENKGICKILITLGADVNCKDRRERTPLICAAYSGCAKTVKALLNRNANIDHATLDGETALLCAVRRNNSNVVELLMDRNANVLHRDKTGAGVFETAVKYDAKDAAYAMCTHQRCREFLFDDTMRMQHPMQLLIKHFPEAAKAVMDKCISRSANVSPKHEDYAISYYFELLDPGPDDPDFVAGKRYFGPQVMVKYKRQDLLLHPLTQMLLDTKWSSFGSYVYYLSLMIYICFLIGFTYFLVHERATTVPRNVTDIGMVKEIYDVSGNEYRIAFMLLIFAIVQLLKEVVQIFVQRLNYFKQLENLIEWSLYTLCAIFVFPYVFQDNLVTNSIDPVRQIYLQWVIAIVAIFLCFLNFVLFLRRLELFGIYITMFLVVFRSLVKVMLVFMEFMLAFAVIFYILFKEQPAFSTIENSIFKTLAMSIGEVDFTATFIDSVNQTNAETGLPQNPFPVIGLIFCGIFIYAMCITLMNLLIGLAIGDIDNVQRSAELQRLAMQVDFVAQIEEKYPRFVTRRLYKSSIEFKPNKKSFYWSLRKFRQSFFGALKDLTSTTAEPPSECANIDFNGMVTTLEKNKRQIKALTTTMEAQANLLKSIDQKLDIHFRRNLFLNGNQDFAKEEDDKEIGKPPRKMSSALCSG